MAERLETEMAIFLRSVREELRATCEGAAPLVALRRQRLAGALDHLIMRAEQGEAIDRVSRDSAAMLLAAYAEAAGEGIASDGAAELADLAAGLAMEAKGAGDTQAARDRFVADVRDHVARRRAADEHGLEAAARTRDDLASTAREEAPPLSGEAVTAFLRKTFPGRPAIAAQNFVRPAGVYSKENYSFDLVGLEERPIKAILRRDRGFEIVPTSASGEFALLNALHALGLPVARCIAAQTSDETPLDGPCLIMERISGSPPGMSRTTPDDKAAWAAMVLQLAPMLARLHAVDPGRLPFERQAVPNRERFVATLHDYQDRLHRYQREAYPLVEAAFVWLYNHSGLIDDRRTMVHGDYDMRNVLFDEGRLTAVLDFELAHIGHPAEDLGYIASDVLEAMPYERFLAAYREAGGADIPAALIHYFHLWRWTFHAVCNIVAFSGYRSGIHDDIFLGTVSFVEFRRVEGKLLNLLPGGDLFLQ